MVNHAQIGQVFFDATRRMLVSESQQLYLEPRIFDLLVALLNAERLQLSREQLITQVWQGRVVSESAINRAVSLLRKAFTQLDASQPYLETLPKVGYRLMVPVTIGAHTLISENGVAETIVAERLSSETSISASLAPVIKAPDLADTGFSAATPSITGRMHEHHSNQRHLHVPARWGRWLSLLLLLLLVHFTWQFRQVKPEPSVLSTQHVPKPQTSDEGVETQLSLSLDGQWLSYLQQEGEQKRWYLQPTDIASAAAKGQSRMQIEVGAGTLRFTSLSPDRQWLLYELCQQHQCQVFLKPSPVASDITTSTLAARASTTEADQFLLQLPWDSQLRLSWQQDSKAIYFRQRSNKTQPYVLSRLELATRQLQQLSQPLSPGGDIALAISPDASKLAVVSYLQQAKSRLRIYQREKMTLLAEQDVPFAVNAISWQTDEQLLFGCAEQICRWVIETAVVQPLLHTGTTVESLHWQNGQLWYATVQPKMAIWRQPKPAPSTPWPSAEKQVASSRIDWMPRVADSQLIFLSNRQGEQQIWHKPFGQSEQLLATLPPPAEFVRLALSADGKALVFSHLGAIYHLDVRSRQMRQILDASAQAAVVNFALDPRDTEGSTEAGMIVASPTADAPKVVPSLIYSSTRSGDYQLWMLNLQTGHSTQLTQHGGYSGYLWQGELWYSKYHQDGLYRQNRNGEEQLMLKDFDKINWLNWHLDAGELYFYQPGQGLMQWSVDDPTTPPRVLLATPEQFMHHYQWTKDALWYVRRDQVQGDIYQVALP